MATNINIKLQTATDIKKIGYTGMEVGDDTDLGRRPVDAPTWSDVYAKV